MEIVSDKKRLFQFFNGDRVLYVYGLADLDDDLFEHCTFFGDSDQLKNIFWKFSGLQVPCIVAHAPDHLDSGRTLIRCIYEEMNHQSYALVQEELVDTISEYHTIESKEIEHRMYLSSRNLVPRSPFPHPIRKLHEEDESRIRALIDIATEESWFELSMIRQNQSWGIEIDGKLVAMTGTHVYSLKYGASSLGNVATHPDFRGRGLAAALVAHQCLQMDESISTIGLNVRADNAAAIRCYEKIGFKFHSRFAEIFSTPRSI